MGCSENQHNNSQDENHYKEESPDEDNWEGLRDAHDHVIFNESESQIQDQDTSKGSTELLPLPPQITVWDPQFDSPLFSKLPSELRTSVLFLALTPYQDISAQGVSFNSYGYGTETAFPVVQTVALLRTCRRIYLETHALPASLRTFVSWRLVWAERCPCERAVGPRFNRLTTLDKLNVKELHIYAQQCNLEYDGWAQRAIRSGSHPILSIRRLTITLRHSDFWYWRTTLLSLWI
jgi:hypothetical protein